jgi:hypothetical protein
MFDTYIQQILDTCQPLSDEQKVGLAEMAAEADGDHATH